MSSQCARLLTYLQMNPNGITSLEAALLPKPIMRLSERIRELEALGFKFDHVIEKTEDARYTRYKLINGAKPRTELLAVAQQGQEWIPERSSPSQCSAAEYLKATQG